MCHPGAGVQGIALKRAVASKISAGHTIAVAEINDYEARRELLRKNATSQLARLDALIAASSYHPIDTNLMKAAAVLWAQLRNAGKGGAQDSGLDGDVILAAQARRFPNHLIVTDNIKHFSSLCTAQATAEFLTS